MNRAKVATISLLTSIFFTFLATGANANFRGLSVFGSMTLSLKACLNGQCTSDKSTLPVGFYVGNSGKIYTYSSKGKGVIRKPGRSFNLNGFFVKIIPRGNSMVFSMKKDGYTITITFNRRGNSCRPSASLAYINKNAQTRATIVKHSCQIRQGNAWS